MQIDQKYLSPWYLFTPLIIVVFLLCSFGLFQVLSNLSISEEEYKLPIKQVGEQAMREDNPALCFNLPKQIRYRFISGWSDGKGDGESEYSTTTGNQQKECLGYIGEHASQPNDCKFLKDQKLFWYSNSCFNRLAVINNDLKYCDELDFEGQDYSKMTKIDGDNARLECKANLSVDTKWCYEMQPQTEEGKFEKAAACIIHLTWLTRNITPCLRIDGLDYGVNWRSHRNECISIGFKGVEGSVPRELCEKMVVDDPYASKQYRAWCFAGELHPINDR